MKLKGINPIEQYIERAVLGVVAVALLAALAVQFLLTPNQVEVSGGRSVPPDAVLDVLGDEAETLLGQVQDTEPPLPEFDTPSLAGRLVDGLAFGVDRPLVDRDYGVAALGTGVAIDVGDGVADSGVVLALEVPQPVEPTAAGYWVTVDPYFAEAHPELSRYVPDVQPFDTPGVSVQATIEVEPLMEALRREGEGRRAIPRGWWSAGIEVLEVQAERQRRMADGTWGPTEAVARPSWVDEPREVLRDRGGPAGGEDASDAITRGELTQLVDLARTQPELTSQPAYLRSIAGLPWVRPAEVAQRNEQVTNRDTAQRLLDEMADIEERITEMRARGTTRQSNRPGSDPGGRRGGGGGGGGGGTWTPPGTNTRTDPATPTGQPRLTGIERQIERLENELVELEERLDGLDLGDDFDPRAARAPRPAASGPRADPGAGGGGGLLFAPPPRRDPRGGAGPGRTWTPPRTGGTTSRSRVGLLTEDEADIWTHDLDVVPGAEYRYRVRVGVNNPLFGRAQLLGTEDPTLLRAAEAPMTFSPWTDWTDPIEVDRKSYYFVTAASDRGQLGLASASATVELYQMFYGYYRQATEAVEPGDPLQARFRLPEGLFRFDTDVMEPDEVAAFLDADDNRPGPAGQPAGRPDPGRTGGSDLSDDEEDADEPPAGVIPMEPRLALGLEAVLLDVAPRPADDSASRMSRRVLTEVMFFDPLQGIVVRRPDTDTGAERYSRVALSARAGENATVRPPRREEP